MTKANESKDEPEKKKPGKPRTLSDQVIDLLRSRAKSGGSEELRDGLNVYFPPGSWSDAMPLGSMATSIFGTSATSITPTSTSFLEDRDTLKKNRALEAEIGKLRSERDEALIELAETHKTKEKVSTLEMSVKKLETTIAELQKKERLASLLPKVNSAAQKLLYESEDFRKSFLEENDADTFVMSIDIRRSTELMAKARTAQQFAKFMTELCTQLSDVIRENYGVVDKFTGDGILTFFPNFFSDEDAGWYVISAADRCHRIFREKYKQYRTSFSSILTGVGLGIGIDYGLARVAQVVGSLTVVGIPVVYACRMGGADAGKTLLNQPAYEKITEKYSRYCFLRETEINVKNEGLTLAYEIQLNGEQYSPKPPSWTEIRNKDRVTREADHEAITKSASE